MESDLFLQVFCAALNVLHKLSFTVYGFNPGGKTVVDRSNGQENDKSQEQGGESAAHGTGYLLTNVKNSIAYYKWQRKDLLHVKMVTLFPKQSFL